MAVDIDSLQIKIQASSAQASKNLKDLESALSSIKSVARGGVGLTAVAKQLTKLQTALNGIKVDSSKISGLVSALQSLSTVQKSTGLNSTINALKKLPDITNSLKATNLNEFANQISRVVTAVAPLATEMQKVSRGFAAFPVRIQRLISSSTGLAASNTRTAKSFTLLGSSSLGFLSKLSLVSVAVKGIASVVGGWITESNAYIENLNLFTVAMGEFAAEAQVYAEQVGALMGIDPSEWMRNQGIFQTLLTGFGVGAEDAALMSKNLTQLGYDLSSFFNISFSDSMQKLQSGISGELEPLRRLGFDLSEARLSAIALANGINISVQSMTQAEKAQLRYYAILTQVTTAQGDMARTLQAPANQLRILQASVTQAARALGNIFIPALNAVLPYAIAFVNVIRWVAQEIANLFGFSLPEVDYSSVTESVSGVASAGNDVEESLGGATSAAKELKGALLGIDELNIIEPNASAGGGGGGGGVSAGGGDLGLELPEYDFLGDAIENRASEIFSSLKSALSGFVDFLKSVIPTIVGLIDTFSPSIKGILTALGLIKAMNWLRRLGQASAVLGGASTVLGAAALGAKGFAAALKAGYKPMDALRYGWLEFSGSMKKLSPFTKAAVTVGGLGAEFVVVYNSVKDLVSGNKDLGEALLNIVPTVGIVGALMKAMFPQWGLLATAIGGVVAAILGYNDAQYAMRAATVEETFFDGQGESLEHLADNYRTLIENMGEAKDPLLEMTANIGANRDKISDLSTEIGTLATGISQGVLSAEENLPKLNEAFTELHDTSVETLQQTRDAILYALAGSVGQALTEAGIDLREYYALINRTTDEATVSLDEFNEKMMQLNKDYEAGVISTSEWDVARQELLAEYGHIFDALDENVSAFNVTLQKYADIDFKDADYEAVFNDVGAAATEAKDNIDAAAEELASTLEMYKNLATTEADKNMYQDYINAVFGDADKQKEAIDAKVQEFYNTIATSLINGTTDQYEAALAEWDNLSFVDKLLQGGNEAAYVKETLEIYKKEQIDPIVEQLHEAFGSALGEGGDWADEAFDEMMSSLFPEGGFKTEHVVGFGKDVQSALEEVLPKYTKVSGEIVVDGVSSGIESDAEGVTSAINTLGTKIQTAANNTLPDIMETAGKDSALGLKNGIASQASLTEVSGAMTDLANEGVVDAYKTALQQASPSKKTEALAKDTVQGFANGFTNNTNLVSSAMGTMLNALIAKMETFTNRCRSALNSLISDFASAMRNVSVSAAGKVTYSLLGMKYISRFAEGGYPMTGQLFLAREAGPEMVGTIGNRTAVANNQQIVEGISYGVSVANEGVISTIYSAVQQIITAMQEQSSDMYMDGDKVAEIVTRYQNRRSRVYGQSVQTI